MSNKIFKSKNVIYMAQDEEGNARFYLKNPAEIPSTENLSAWETSINSEISEYIPHCDRWHPVAIQMRYTQLRESMPFMPDKIDSIIDGSSQMHVEDLSGSFVSILPEPIRFGRYNIGGYVLDRANGNPLELRLYNTKGECFDGQEEHSLEIVAGPSPFSNMPDIMDLNAPGKSGDVEITDIEPAEAESPAEAIEEKTPEPAPEQKKSPAAASRQNVEITDSQSPVIPSLPTPRELKTEKAPKEHSEDFKTFFRSISVRKNDRTKMIERFNFDEQ